ncbi:MAG: hypothetical protein HY216_00845 [Candidatus Rokubacteria bacterium]|nr:hypothetical protein [Candidatus Rokubacteria bacterium]
MSEPGVVRRLWRAWKRLGKKIGDFQARLLLTVFYFVIVAPFGLGMRLFGDPLAVKPRTGRGWRERPATVESELTRASRQF